MNIAATAENRLSPVIPESEALMGEANRESMRSYLEINCCTSNVNPPPSVRWNDTEMDLFV
ncbi:MAG: hypothetical protein ABIE07_02090 [Candidatus Zixiibacteriota bacterium]